MPTDAFAAARSDFPGAVASPYLNVASRGIVSKTTMAAATALLGDQLDGSASKEAWAPIATSARARFAQLIGAAPDEIAFTKNVSEGLNVIAGAFPWADGDNVVLCPAVEHPNNLYAWLNLRRRGVAVRAVPARADAVDLDAMLAAIDARTRVLAVASVSFTPGFRADLASLGAACRARGVMLVVDAVQSCGVLRHDVAAERIDALATSTTKGLLGTHGQGFLHVRRDWIARLEPASLARFSVDQGDAHESEMGGLEFRLRDDAQRFEIGNHNWTGLAAADAALGQILALGSAAIEAHAVGLAARLADGLEALGLKVRRPPAGVEPTHIVTVGTLGAGGAYSTADARLDALARVLEADGVRFSVRRGLLRFATHLYNDESDVARVLALAGSRARAAAE